MIRGVIFDMDGLMTDTERLFLWYWCQIMRERGLPEHREMVVHCIGLSHQATETYIWETLGRDFDYRSILEEVSRRSQAYCAAYGVPVKPGLYPLMDYLDRAGIPYAVATSTRQENARRRLQSIGVLDRIRCLITGDMVSRGKPDPEIFQLAAEGLRLPPEDCMVLEDSPHGLAASRAAGCVTVMVPDLLEPDRETLTLLDDLAQRLDQVIAIVERYNRI